MGEAREARESEQKIGKGREIIHRPLSFYPRNTQPNILCPTNVRPGEEWKNGHTWNWLSLKFQREYNCNQSLFLQSLLQKLTTTKEQFLITTSSLFQKRPLVVTMKWKLMLHQEIQLKYPQIQTVSLKIVVSVKCQNSLVIQVCKNMSSFSCYCSIVQYYI